VCCVENVKLGAFVVDFSFCLDDPKQIIFSTDARKLSIIIIVNLLALLRIQGDSEIILEKKPVNGDDEKKSLTKYFSYKSFFVFETQMMENFVKIASTLLS
jgi:hypothetical protein